MRKESITKRGLLRYHSYNKRYFPLRFAQILFDNFAPYFTLWMSAELVTALYENRARESLYVLIGVTLIGNLAVRVAGAALRRSADMALKVLESRETEAFNKKTLSLDYEKLENPDIRQHRRSIRENSYINWFGIMRVRLLIEMTFSAALNILFSLALFAEMAASLAGSRLTPTGLLLLALLVVTIMASALLNSHTQKKISQICSKLTTLMLDENKIGRGFRFNGMDYRIYRQKTISQEIWRHVSQTHLRVNSKVRSQYFRLECPAQLVTKAGELCSYLLVCCYCTLGAFPVGSVIKYVGYLSRLTGAIGTLMELLIEFRENEKFVKIYLDYFDIPNDMYQGSLSVEKRSDRKFDIEFRNVSFRYPGTDAWALRSIDLTLKVGERLAVVGMNGSGKTTFIKLLCRLYDPTEGEILMNDFNIRKYDYRQYLDLFSVVFQDYTLLSMPLGNNVASAERWDTARAEQLLREVGFGERYAQMPGGLSTPLYKDFDSDGVNLSGGEAQKVALARALYKDAPFIILDEPTAALDPIAEAEIYAHFDGIVGDKTAIYISHRLSSCRFCDKIAVFDEGKLVQVGRHEELLAVEGKYAELWNAQAQYYTEKQVG